MAKKMLGVLYGSRSCEHEVSIITALQLMRSVNRDQFDVTPIYITQSGEWYTGEKLLDLATYNQFDPYRSGLKRVSLDLTAGSGALLHYSQGKGLFRGLTEEVVARIDCFIPALHGMHGEDGSIQGLLELADVPYTSAGIVGSAIGMDKITMKRFFLGMGYPTLPGVSLLRSRYEESPERMMDEVEKELSYPVVVKPADLGSSIGVSFAADRAELSEALDLAFQYDRRVLAEKGLDHPVEINCSVLGFDGKTECSALEMPLSGGEVLDFAKKYLEGSSSAKGMASMGRVINPEIGEETSRKIRELSQEIFTALDCKGVVRIDFMIDRATDQLYITEINTIPGSMSFYLWDKAGVSYPELIGRMVALAEQAHREKEQNNFAYRSEILKSVRLGGTKGKLKTGKL